MSEYDIVVVLLSEEDGGGFLGIVPDLPGCMSDGKTRAEAIINTESAIKEWITTQKGRGLPIPAYGSYTQKIQEKRHDMASKLDECLESLANMDTRLNGLEREVSYIREVIENLEERERFSDISPVLARFSFGVKKSHEMSH